MLRNLKEYQEIPRNPYLGRQDGQQMEGWIRWKLTTRAALLAVEKVSSFTSIEIPYRFTCLVLESMYRSPSSWHTSLKNKYGGCGGMCFDSTMSCIFEAKKLYIVFYDHVVIFHKVFHPKILMFHLLTHWCRLSSFLRFYLFSN